MRDDETPGDPVPDTAAPRRPYGPVWRIFALIFVVMAGVCAYRIATAGLLAALSDDAFAYLAIATLLLGCGLAWPVALRVLERGVGGDARNAMERTRAGWFMRRR